MDSFVMIHSRSDDQQPPKAWVEDKPLQHQGWAFASPSVACLCGMILEVTAYLQYGRCSVSHGRTWALAVLCCLSTEPSRIPRIHYIVMMPWLSFCDLQLSNDFQHLSMLVQPSANLTGSIEVLLRGWATPELITDGRGYRVMGLRTIARLSQHHPSLSQSLLEV